ncbi:centrosomal protein of 68 kDa [Meriones unguiculatus]|uniref:centrosomal protein of 68 kDa n=1 Tax=Meriones unguiculatus TaxID=10047 RepID=UPI000B4FCF51|nr:centrosomal protein of 68 kDa [Meriones unguiculatus]XP_060221182.1 centrosomal protein of 68 kDa [Meriones unguiculatus]XP_060221183.1 centrosomal protein of 68 kDa [Meriones unguiculatus]XP_060221184.1 centrosomal protein of 68 kDa [Meriones unguiculatus]
MALGEDEAEAEASVNTKVPPCSRWNSGELLSPGLEPEQPPHLEVEGGPLWRAEANPGCISGVFLSQVHPASREPVADRSKPTLNSPLPSASVGTEERLPSMESQMEENRLPASQELIQTVKVLGTITVCSGHDADSEVDQSAVDSSQVLGLSQQPHISGLPLLAQWKCTGNPVAPQLSSRSISASSVGSSLQDHQEKAEPQSGSFANTSSQELTVPQAAPSVMEIGPQLQWSSQPVASGSDVAGLGKRQLSFQAEYWACVLPDSLPPSPNRQSPLWNPNKEYEDLLDYTYPLRPGPQLPKQLASHVQTDPVMQDSGVDLDSFSVSPASTLKSLTNVSHSCSSAEVPALPFSGAREPCLKRCPLGVSQKQGGISLASWNQLASTPRAPGTEDASWGNREAAMRGTKDCPPVGKNLSVGSPQLRTKEREQSFPTLAREKKASQNTGHPTYVKPGWTAEEEMESDDEYLALPTRLTQVSSLVSYLGAIPTFVNLPTGAAEEHSSLEVSDSDRPASPTVDSSQTQHPSGAAFQGPAGQKHCFMHSIAPQDSTGKSSLMGSQALRVSSGLLKTQPSLQAAQDRWSFSEQIAGGKLPRKAGEWEKASLVQCVQTFCCQLEELICWLYNVTDVAELSTPSRSSLTGLKSSLQLYRQFKKDVDEHQSLTDSVLEKGEILLQCLLDNTPVLKDVLERIAKQSGELENHADHLYDSILASLDMLAGCTLIPDNRPTAAKEHPHEQL